jgi:hypothetical protein
MLMSGADADKALLISVENVTEILPSCTLGCRATR